MRRLLVPGMAGLCVMLLASIARGTPASLESAKYPIRVTYDSPTDDALAAATLPAAENAWELLVTKLGFPSAWVGGVGTTPITIGMEFRLADTGMGAGAATAVPKADIPATPCCDCTGLVTIDRATSPASADLEETAFHELVHTSQFAADCGEALSYYEGFALALLDAHYPQSSYPPKLMQFFQRYPEYPLDFVSMDMECKSAAPCFGYLLGAGLYWVYLEQRWGNATTSPLLEVIQGISQDGTATPFSETCSEPNHPNWFEAVDGMLQSRGTSFREAFVEFSAWRAITGKHDDGHHFTRGASYPEPAVASSIPLQAGQSGKLDVREYGTRFLELTAYESAPPSRLLLSVDPASEWSASVLIWRADAPVAIVVTPFEGGQASVELPDLHGATRVVLAVSQLQDDSHVPDESDFDNAREFSWEVLTAMADDGGSDAADAADEGELDGSDGPTGPREGSESGAGCDCRMSAWGHRHPSGSWLLLAWLALPAFASHRLRVTRCPRNCRIRARAVDERSAISSIGPCLPHRS